MDVRCNFVYILMTIYGATFLSGESNLMSDLLKMFQNKGEKEHLETGLTIKASYKVGHILELTHIQIVPFMSHGSRIHTYAWEKQTRKAGVLTILMSYGHFYKNQAIIYLCLYDHFKTLFILVAPKVRMQILGSFYAFKLVKNIIANFLYAFS